MVILLPQGCVWKLCRFVYQRKSKSTQIALGMAPVPPLAPRLCGNFVKRFHSYFSEFHLAWQPMSETLLPVNRSSFRRFAEQATRSKLNE